ncbi:cystinosin [Kwoniella heveanensis CBS 569]|uniref:Cystinosin n=1 Tax=Kwoniella heveanensis BCC8398 TaxID=1296120 RepID=A0A1B9H0A8_9TREE|nr:cystinosin [Kwoniella heveanensis BCC8398]OCF43143.1 cystinosin [Kwoniella heveanensis CBS 569]
MNVVAILATSNAGAHDHPFWNAIVSICGVAYFVAWSYSFYPQIILNYKRKKTTGLSPDFIYLNPLGFLALTIWSWGAYFSPVARRQYQDRHEGHLPQISKSDLAFSLHALLISLITLIQVWWYARRLTVSHSGAAGESDPLIASATGAGAGVSGDEEGSKVNDLLAPLAPTTPSIPCQFALAGLFFAASISAILVWSGKTQFLDWLYLVSSIKLFISAVKYIPQVVLNYRLRSVDGFAIGQIVCDLIGSVLSFAQLVISSTFIDHHPSGIIANPAKLGLSFLSLTFDLIFIAQKYWFFARNKTDEDEVEGGAGDEED